MNVGLSLGCSCPRHSALLSKAEGVEQYFFTVLLHGCGWIWWTLQEIHTLKTQLEAAKYDVIKYCIGKALWSIKYTSA
jgi:hypothetical protein